MFNVWKLLMFYFVFFSVCLTSTINFQNEIVALITLGFQTNRCVFEVNSTGHNLTISFASRNLINESNRCDSLIAALIFEWESHVFRHDLQELWWSSSDALVDDKIITWCYVPPSRVCARYITSQGEQRKTEHKFHFHFFLDKLQTTDEVKWKQGDIYIKLANLLSFWHVNKPCSWVLINLLSLSGFILKEIESESHET